VSNPRNLKKGGAEAGILTGSATGTGSASLAEIAIWNELGTEWGVDQVAPGGNPVHIPARPFIGSTADEKQREWKDTVARVNRLVLAGKIDNDTASEILGQQMQADIQQKIVDLRDPPNAEATIKKKKSDNPLIDTGAMKDAVKYEVLS
jgi:hypothetical protein